MKPEGNRYIDKVKKFHELFGLPIHDHHLAPTTKDHKLRINLLVEELDELKEAFFTRESWLEKNTNKNREWHIEMLDALCDLQYVLSGAILQLGYHEIFDDAFDEVQRSNMSKLFYCTDDAAMDKECRYLNKKYPKAQIEFDEVKPNTYVIRRLSDGKILKPSGYSAANLRRFFDFSNDT